MATKEDIQFHYDVDNNFYQSFLDKTYRAYSCGVWRTAETLELAQQHKLDRLCRFANVSRGDAILDVGCGWGGLMERAIQKFGASSAHGLTLSADQTSFIKELARPDISVDLRSWQDFNSFTNHYDAIISIGAFEHFASLEDRQLNRHRDVYKKFFQWCRKVSKDDAHVALQTIVTSRQPRTLSEVRDTRYLLEKVFPGSALPSISDIQASVSDVYEISSAKRIGLDYARTLSHWEARLKEHEQETINNYGRPLYDHYMSYFSQARRSFEAGVVDLYQISLQPVKQARVVF
ncbi:Cyclopropane mycolic acid synthase MmaA2 [Curvibacter sp. AEP1-3]|uniref:SAM-dependent methyltransferase n=1 Tax=Curvibacter sp. AEP1-3 TaxID=1844971 RepID=UPI000B3C61C0|nr:cyclopropane-fatty-acyl-phospholipid synthase family protein [Curvibacter sp. AEP1-3]ARV19181.1 Cyclopropane mycolic acid synthase MmaA2 [Curvibacter sp. AEP1-3]